MTWNGNNNSLQPTSHAAIRSMYIYGHWDWMHAASRGWETSRQHQQNSDANYKGILTDAARLMLALHAALTGDSTSMKFIEWTIAGQAGRCRSLIKARSSLEWCTSKTQGDNQALGAVPAMVPAKRSAETLATLPMTGEVTTATVMAAHFQLCSHAFATTGGKPAAVKTEAVYDSKKMIGMLTVFMNKAHMRE